MEFCSHIFDTLPSLEFVVEGWTGILVLGQESGGASGETMSPLQAFFSSPLPLIAGLAMIWYLTWFLPEKRKRQDETNLLASLMKNDRVITIGGIHGTVVSVTPDSDVVTLKIDEAGTTRVKVNRSAISAISVHAKGKSLSKDGKPTQDSKPDQDSKPEKDSKPDKISGGDPATPERL